MPKVYGEPRSVAAFAITVSADGKAEFSVEVLAAFAVITPLIDEPSIEKAQSPAINPVPIFLKNLLLVLNINSISPFLVYTKKKSRITSTLSFLIFCFIRVILHNYSRLSYFRLQYDFR